jgi:ATP synthase protein I
MIGKKFSMFASAKSKSFRQLTRNKVLVKLRLFFRGGVLHPQVRWVLYRQAFVALGVAVIAAPFSGAWGSVSALIGGVIGILSGAAYAWRAFRRDAVDPKQAYQAQLLGEAYKFLVTVLLFAAVFLGCPDVAVGPLFVAYALTFVVYWMALLKQR